MTQQREERRYTGLEKGKSEELHKRACSGNEGKSKGSLNKNKNFENISHQDC